MATRGGAPALSAPRSGHLIVALCLALVALVKVAGPASALAGALDTTFDGDGVVMTPVGDDSSAEDVLVQADDRIVVVGHSSDSGGLVQPTLVRYLAGGGLDPDFGGGDGVLVPSMDGLAGADLHAVAEGPNGTLVTGGVACVVAGEGFSCGPTLVARFTAAGDLDTTFGGGDGVVTHPNAGAARDVAVRPDGGVVALAGIQLLAFEADGDPDPLFGGGDGVADLSPNIITSEFAFDAEERVVVVGSTFNPRDLWMARLESDGDLDTTFSGGDGDADPGILRMDLSSVTGKDYPGDNAVSVAIDSSGRVVVGGGTERSNGSPQSFVLRLTSAGVPDNSFSGDGFAFNNLPTRTWFGADLAIQPDGAIVFAGSVWDPVEEIHEAMVGRFLATGAPDASLGGSGIAWFDVRLISARHIALQDDGAVVLAGQMVHTALGQTHIGAVRFVVEDPCTKNGTPGPDTLTGTAGPDVLCGLGGNDVLLGKGGNDVLIGGPGLDVASYAGAGTAITANLATGTATGQGTDTLEGMERVTGGLRADRITGNAAANTLTGGGGSDTLNGGGGADSLVGGDGSDVLNGGAGNDTLNGGPGTDDCNQGAGSGPKTSCET